MDAPTDPDTAAPILDGVRLGVEVLDSIPDLLITIDGRGRVTYANAEASEVFRQSREDLIGRGIRELVPDLDDWLEDDALDRIRAREPVQFSAHVPSVGRWFDVRTLPHDGGIVVIATDVTLRVSRRNRLRLLTSAVEELVYGVVISDARRPGFPVVYTNPAFTRLTGLEQAEVLERESRYVMETMMREEWGEEHAATFLEAITEGRPGRILIRARRQSGAPFWKDFSVYPIPDEDGDMTHLVGTFDDVTTRVEAEHKLREMASDLRSLSRRLVQFQETERRSLALDLHDEVGQSLTALSLTLQAAAQAPERAAGLAAEASREVRRIQAHVRDLSLRLRPSMLDDLGLIPALEWLATWSREHFGLEVALEPSRALPPLASGTAMAAYRIVQEALTNAAKYSGTEQVRVFVNARGGSVEVRVRDEGVGFDLEVARGERPGGGLSGIVERAAAAGGEALVLSRPGNGTLVWARLPIEDGGGPADQPRPALVGMGRRTHR